MASTTDRRKRTGWILGGIAGAGAIVGAILLTRKPSATTVTSTGIKVTFSGISGVVTSLQDHLLPDMLTRIDNTSTVDQDITVTAATQAFPWSLDTRPGHGLPSSVAPESSLLSPAPVTFSLAAGASVTLPWTALYQSSYGQGPFTNTLTIEVGTMPTASFTDPTTWTLSVSVAPAAADVAFSGGPSAVTIDEGSNATLATLTTTLTNTGQASATFAITCTITGPTAAQWFVSSAPSSVTISDVANIGVSNSGGTVTLAGGASVAIEWSTIWDTAEPTQDGTYTNVANVSW